MSWIIRDPLSSHPAQPRLDAVVTHILAECDFATANGIKVYRSFSLCCAFPLRLKRALAQSADKVARRRQRDLPTLLGHRSENLAHLPGLHRNITRDDRRYGALAFACPVALISTEAVVAVSTRRAIRSRKRRYNLRGIAKVVVKEEFAAGLQVRGEVEHRVYCCDAPVVSAGRSARAQEEWAYACQGRPPRLCRSSSIEKRPPGETLRACANLQRDSSLTSGSTPHTARSRTLCHLDLRVLIPGSICQREKQRMPLVSAQRPARHERQRSGRVLTHPSMLLLTEWWKTKRTSGASMPTGRSEPRHTGLAMYPTARQTSNISTYSRTRWLPPQSGSCHSSSPCAPSVSPSPPFRHGSSPS